MSIKEFNSVSKVKEENGSVTFNSNRETDLIKNLSGSEYMLYTYVQDWKERTGRSGLPNNALITEKTNLSRTTVFRIVKKLKENRIL